MKVPTEVATERGFLRSTGGVSLSYAAHFQARDAAVVVISHGYGEHQGRYDHVVARLWRTGTSALTFDFRGHGQSGGARGHVARFEDYLDDLETAIAAAQQRAPAAPLFLLGHSQGGLVVALYLAERATQVAGVVMTSPFMGFTGGLPSWKVMLARSMSRLAPAFASPNGVRPDDLSHDPEVVARYRLDPLVHHVATARWFTEVEGAHARALVAAGQINEPILVVQAGDDRVVSLAATERFFGLIGSADKELEIVPQGYHELLNERDSGRTFDRILSWLAGHRPAATPASSPSSR